MIFTNYWEAVMIFTNYWEAVMIFTNYWEAVMIFTNYWEAVVIFTNYWPSSNDIHEIINYCLEQITIVNTLCQGLSLQTSAQAH